MHHFRLISLGICTRDSREHFPDRRLWTIHVDLNVAFKWRKHICKLCWQKKRKVSSGKRSDHSSGVTKDLPTTLSTSSGVVLHFRAAPGYPGFITCHQFGRLAARWWQQDCVEHSEELSKNLPMTSFAFSWVIWRLIVQNEKARRGGLESCSGQPSSESIYLQVFGDVKIGSREATKVKETIVVLPVTSMICAVNLAS